MSNVVYLDFETYSEANLKKHGVGHYARHPSTKILIVAFAYNDEPAVSFTPGEGVTTPEELKLMGFLNEGNIKIVAHNVQFEYSLIQHVAVPRMNWPEVAISRFIDTMMLAATVNLPQKLEDLAEYLKLPIKKMKGTRLITFFSKPNIYGTQTLLADKPEKAAEFIRYCEVDVEVTREVLRALPIKDLSPVERDTWELDFKINEFGIPVDVELVTECAKLVSERIDQKKADFIDKFGVNPNNPTALKEFLVAEGVDVDNTQRETLEALNLDEVSENAKTAVKTRLAINHASVKKYPTMEGAEVEGRIYGCLKYQGAVTGRWSSKIVQFHNLARPTVYNPDVIARAVYEGLPAITEKYQNPLGALSSLLRHVIKSDIGFNVIDFSSIEARVVAWIAGQEDSLKIFRGNGDIYKHTAAKIFSVPVDKVSTAQRVVGKVATLALGYQGWVNSFNVMSRANKLDITDEQAETIIKGWRKSNSKIVKLWKDVEQVAMEVVRTGRKLRIGMLEFGVHKQWLYVRLPSGRGLSYPDPVVKKAEDKYGRVRDKIFYYGGRKGLVGTYGGKLVENITQAIARDLLRDALLRLDSAGYNICFHVHDSVVIECKDELPVIEKLFTYVPEWADGLPIHAESYFANNYKK